MNAERRKRLQETMARLNEALQSEDAIADIIAVADEEQEAFENLSENLQAGEKGQKMEETASRLREAAEALEQARDDLDTAVSEACE